MDIYIREIDTNDAELINSWRTDEHYELTTSNKNYVSLERERDWIKFKLKQKDVLYLGICLKQSGELIGFLKVDDIDHRNRRAEYGGILICEKYQGNKYATQALKCILEYVFGELNMIRFYGYVLEDHKISLQWLFKNGFKQEGLLRSHIYKNYKYKNVCIVSIMRDEYSNTCSC